MEHTPPQAVKNLISDMVVIYGLYADVLNIIRVPDYFYLLIFKIEELYKNRIIEPLDEAKTVKAKLKEHFELIKYENLTFLIQHEERVYRQLGNLEDIFQSTILNRKPDLVLRSLKVTFEAFVPEMKSLHSEIIDYSKSLDEIAQEEIKMALEIIHENLKKPKEISIPQYYYRLFSVLNPVFEHITVEHIYKAMQNRAIAYIAFRLLDFEPWKSINSPEKFVKIFSNISGPDDERLQSILLSSEAIKGYKSLVFSPKLEADLIHGNREFIKYIYFLFKQNNSINKFSFKRNLIKILYGNKSINTILIPTINLKPTTINRI